MNESITSSSITKLRIALGSMTNEDFDEADIAVFEYINSAINNKPMHVAKQLMLISMALQEMIK
jgi:hypothetical protein